MRSLAIKLTLAFLIVSLTVTVLVAFFTRYSTAREFDQLVVNRALDDFIEQVTTHYANNGSIDDIAVNFRIQTRMPRRQEGDPPPGAGQFPNEPHLPFPNMFALVNIEGSVVLGSGPYQLGDQPPESELSKGAKIVVDGETIGTALFTGAIPALDKREEQYLQRTNQALFFAALISMVIALFLAVFFSRTLTRPLRELTSAIRNMAKGELEQKVPIRSKDELGELAESFNQMSSDLARSNQARRQMTADIAHDLRTPLTVIGGYIEALRDGVLQPSPQRFESLYNEVGHLQRLVQDLRTLSLADAGELALNRQSINPGDLLERIEAIYQHAAVAKSIQLVLENSKDLPNIFVDEDRMVQVLGNLVINAIRYTPEGGQVTLASRLSNEGVQLSIKDNGEGIPQEAQPYIFDRFYRGDHARADENGETGLGLAIARSIVIAHGGNIRVESELGAGSEFIITFPIHQTD